jgi:hypothetical protein
MTTCLVHFVMEITQVRKSWQFYQRKSRLARHLQCGWDFLTLFLLFSTRQLVRHALATSSTSGTHTSIGF